MTDFWKRRGMDTFQECIGGVFAITTQDFVELNVKRGQQWYITEKFPMIAGATTDFYFATGSSPIILKFRSIVANVNDLDFEIYVGGTVSDPGTPVVIHNANAIYQETLLTSAYINPTVTTLGTLNERDWLPGAPDTGTTKGSGSFLDRGFEKVIPPNGTSIARFRNNGSIDGDVLYAATFYEGPVVPEGPQNLHNPYRVNDPNGFPS